MKWYRGKTNENSWILAGALTVICITDKRVHTQTKDELPHFHLETEDMVWQNGQVDHSEVQLGHHGHVGKRAHTVRSKWKKLCHGALCQGKFPGPKGHNLKWFDEYLLEWKTANECTIFSEDMSGESNNCRQRCPWKHNGSFLMTQAEKKQLTDI